MNDTIQRLFQLIESLTSTHKNKIFDDCKKYSDIPKKIFSTSLEIENGLRMFCYGINFEAYSYSLIILRQLTEQVCFFEVASGHKECFKIISEYAKLKLDCLKFDNHINVEIKNKYKDSKQKAINLWKDAKKKFSKIKKISLNDFLEYGWMLEFTDECGIEKLYELADFKKITVWRKLSNSLVHNTISFYQHHAVEQERLIIESLYIVIALLDSYMCSYHNLTGFDFIIDSVDFRELFHFVEYEFLKYRKNLYYKDTSYDK